MEKLDPVARLTRDLAQASKTLSHTEARFLVDAYYTMQGNRIRADGQIRSMARGETFEPHSVLMWLSDQNATLEAQIKRALTAYVESHPVGPWLTSIYGIGPVISAGLLAHIDIERAPTAGHIWSFAGLDPTKKWNKGERRPWNAALKVLCWKAGESFVKFHKNEQCFYGKYYASQKALYEARNDAGAYAERAAQILKECKIGKDTDAYAAYSAGRLPKAQIHAMARRYAVKLFLSHLHGEMYRRILKQEPPLPYPIAHQGHAHFIQAP